MMRVMRLGWRRRRLAAAEVTAVSGGGAGRMYTTTKDNETAKGIANAVECDHRLVVAVNKSKHPGITANSNLHTNTQLIIPNGVTSVVCLGRGPVPREWLGLHGRRGEAHGAL